MLAAGVLAAATAGAVVLVAEAASDPTIAQYLNYGMAGLWILALATGQFRTKAEVEGLKSDKAELQRQVTELLALQREQALPAIASSASALRGSAQHVAGLAATLQRLEEAIRRIEGQQGT